MQKLRENKKGMVSSVEALFYFAIAMIVLTKGVVILKWFIGFLSKFIGNT